MAMRRARPDARGFKLQTCMVCNCTDKFNFYVPDRGWREVVRREYQNKVVC